MSDDTPTSPNRRIVATGIDATKLVVPVTALIGLFGVAFGAHLWLQAQFAAIQAQLQANNQASVVSLQEIRNRLDRFEERYADRWTSTDMRLWVLELSRANPTLTVPPPTQSGSAAARPR